ncbi:MAG TPA: PAS domain S-box protein [Bacteroidota bacterium]|nr:PAS domain S-box protein [Bacteroidota bacterium]
MESDSLTLLVIDDNRDNIATFRAVVADMLPSAIVHSALDGITGLDAARREDVDIIFLDIVMPGMDGFEVCRRLKADDALHGIPVVFLTALKTDREIRIRALDAGAEGFLSKPIDETELLAQVRAMRKIRVYNAMRESEKERLAAMVELRTAQLRSELEEKQIVEKALRETNEQLRISQRATLNLMEDLRAENIARRASEDALRHSEENLKMAQRVAGMGSWIWHIQDNTVEWSDQMYPIFGIRREDFTGNLTDVIASAIHPEDKEKVEASNRAVAEHGKAAPLEYRIVRADGTERIVYAEAGEMEVDERGQPQHLAGYVQDITERKRAEALIRESEERWRAIIKASPDGIVVTTLDGKLEEVSESGLRMFGYRTLDEVRGRQASEFIVAEERALAEEGLKSLLAGDYSGSTEFHGVRKDGSVFHLEINAEVLRANDGSPQHIVLIERDVTDRKIAEQQLRESREQFYLAMQATNDGLYDWDLVKNTIYYSPAWKRMLGYDEQELPNDFSIWELLTHPEDVERSWKMFDEVVHRHRPRFEMEFRMRHKDGHWVNVLSRARPVFDDDGVAIRMVGTHVDISERKKAEAALRESESKYRLLFENMTQAFILHDVVRDADGSAVDFIIRSVNPTFLRMTGETLESVLGRNIRDTVVASGERLYALFKEVVESKSARHLEMYFSETSAYIELWVYPNSSGEQIAVIFSDVTARRNAEQALRESEELHRTLVNGLPDVIMRLDRDLRHIYVSDNVQDFAPFPPSAYIGKTHREMGLSEEQCVFWEESLRQVLDSAISYESEFSWGETENSVTFQWRVIPELAEDGTVRSLITIARDITRQKQLEHDYRMLFEQMLEGFALHELICDDKGTPIDYRFLNVNSAFVQYTGLSEERVLGRTVREAIPDIEPQWIETYGRVVRTGESTSFEQYAGGIDRWYHVSAFKTGPMQFATTFVDITERKHAEEAVRESYDMLNKLASQVPGVVYQYQLFPDGRSCFPFSSKGMWDIYEVLPEEVRSDASPVFDRLHPDDRDRVSSHILQSAKELSLFHDEYRVILPTQGLRWRLCDAVPELLADGSVMWYGIITDITDRRQAAQRLEESEQRLRAITESARDAIIMADDNGRISYWNPAAASMFGYSQEEAMGLQVHDLLTPDSTREDAIQAMHRYLSTGEAALSGKSRDLLARHRNGALFDISISLAPVRIQNSWHSVALIRDITDWKLAEHALRASEQRFRSMIEHSPIAYLSLDAAGRILDYNDETLRLFGAADLDIHGVAFKDFWHESIRDQFDELYQLVLDSGGRSDDIILQRPHGTSVDVYIEGRVEKDARGVFLRTHCVMQNITERKRAERAQQESEAFAHAILDSVTSNICVIDSAGNILAVNEPWLRFARENGADSARQIQGVGIGTNYLVICETAIGTGSEDATAVRNGITTVLRRELPFYMYEYSCDAPTMQRWFVLMATPLASDLGGAVISHTEITERKLAEQALRESEGVFRSLFEEHPAVKLIIDPDDGTIVDANPAASAFYGWSVDELRTMNISRINTLPREALSTAMKKTVNAGTQYLQFQHRRADGSLRDVEVLAGTVNMRGKLHLHSVVFDITEKKRAEHANKLLRRSIEQSPISIIVTDASGIIEYVNPQFTRNTGYSSEDAIGGTMSIVKSGEHDDAFYANLWRTITEGKEWIGEFHNRRRNGELYWERSIISSVTDERGYISHFIAVKEDTTEQRRLLAELIAAKEKAEESDRLKSTFLANMSHEVRTPMNAIIGFADLLNAKEIRPDEQEQYTGIIKQRSYDLLAIINDILDISMIDSGQIKIYPELWNVEELLHDLYITYSHLIAQSEDTQCTLQLANSLPDSELVVMMDAQRVRQVLVNLLSNAMKFTKEGCITFGCQRHSDDELEFYVSDTGIGIPEEAFEFIFNRFRQVDESSTRPYGGTGLGLSISRGFVELMGGRIWVESEVGKGSIFHFTLPYKTS